MKLILALAVSYAISNLKVNRDSEDDAVVKAYRRVALKAHPDKGGSVADMQLLQDLNFNLVISPPESVSLVTQVEIEGG